MSQTKELDSANALLQAPGVPRPWLYFVAALGASMYLGIITPRTMLWILAAVACLVGAIVYYQESILYHPVIQGWKTPADNPSGYQAPSQQRLDYEDVYFTASDGTKLHGWFIPAPKSLLANPEARPATMLFCHENAGNIGLRIPEFKQVHQMLKVNQFVFDYRKWLRARLASSLGRQPLVAHALDISATENIGADRSSLVHVCFTMHSLLPLHCFRFRPLSSHNRVHFVFFLPPFFARRVQPGGYGFSEGVPSEGGLVLDALAAYAYLQVEACMGVGVVLAVPG